MPLPPALAAKLAKRGIINIPKDAEPESAASAEEEIIAEDYDETPQQMPHAFIPVEAQIVDPYVGYPSCPNKWNVYHECSNSCREQWKDRKAVTSDYERRRAKMLLKYPLPNHWQEIMDVGIGRYYYWNTETDLVSWLPPGHPRCQVSRSAATLRKEMAAELSKNRPGDADNDTQMTRVEEEEEDMDDHQDGDELMSDKSEGSDDESSQPEKRNLERRVREKGRELLRNRNKGRRPPQGEELDPMDPASYGECGRGTWASGLPQRNEARTGADVTASGPLFQMRPYPSPGAVLRANAAAAQIGPKKT